MWRRRRKRRPGPRQQWMGRGFVELALHSGTGGASDAASVVGRVQQASHCAAWIAATVLRPNRSQQPSCECLVGGIRPVGLLISYVFCIYECSLCSTKTITITIDLITDRRWRRRMIRTEWFCRWATGRSTDWALRCRRRDTMRPPSECSFSNGFSGASTSECVL